MTAERLGPGLLPIALDQSSDRSGAHTEPTPSKFQSFQENIEFDSNVLFCGQSSQQLYRGLSYGLDWTSLSTTAVDAFKVCTFSCTEMSVPPANKAF